MHRDVKKTNTIINTAFQVLQRHKNQRKHGSPNNNAPQFHKKSAIHTNILNFDINNYPFMNQQTASANIYRTSLSLKISNEQLRKMMRFNHNNMINLQKITKGHNKDAMKEDQQSVFFSFYYEEVTYSLKYVGLYQERTNSILKRMTQISLKSLLQNLSQYLARFGVYYLYNLSDIGVTKQGEIKVFISPLFFCDDRQERKDKNMIIVSINKIVSWWETTLASNTILNPKSSNIILPSGALIEEESSLDQFLKQNQQEEGSQFIGEQYEQNKDYRYSNSKESMLKNYPLKNSNNSIQSQLSRLSSIQISKIKRIDQEIKYIKQRLKNKRRIHKESETITEKKDKYRSLVESERYQKKDMSCDKINTGESNVIEKIQQNINCINIYTHPKETTPKNTPQTKIKRMTTQPIYSYKIAPDNPKPKNSKPDQKVIVHHPSFEPEDFPNSQSGSSVNTYDMEVEAEIFPAKAVKKNKAFRAQQRQISEKNYRPSHSNQIFLQKKNQNQVINKHVTQSAGPLQFKNFVNRYIKPQFLAKKSNIYQDPMEYESQTSKSISKKKKKIIADLYQTGKSANSHTEKSSSLNQKPQQACYKKKDSACIMEDLNEKSRDRKQSKGLYSRTNSQIKLMPIRESTNDINDVENLKKSKYIGQDSKIGQRVKIVLQKTKNAIALLNRVKNCKSPPPLLP